MKIRCTGVLLLALCLAACNKSSPTSPTPPTGGTPPPTTTSVPPTTTTVPPAPATFTVAGLLRDAGTQAPIGGGNVRVQAGTGLNASSGTDGNGYYSIPGVTGAIVLAFSAPNYDPRSQTVQVNGDTRFDFTLTRTAPPFSRSGTGDNVFSLPGNVSRVRINASYNSSCQNFIVRVGGRLLVNEILGTCSIASGRTFQGTYVVTGGALVEVTGSTGVDWTFTQA